jgi:hypothetical protein
MAAYIGAMLERQAIRQHRSCHLDSKNDQDVMQMNRF